MSIDNVLASGVGVRDDSSSQTSKVRLETGPVRLGPLRKIRNVSTSGTQSIRLTDADSGTLFRLILTVAGTTTFTLASNLSDGATFEFMVTTGGPGGVTINAGTNASAVNRLYIGQRKQAGVPAIVLVSSVFVNANFVAGVANTGDRFVITKGGDLRVHVDGDSVAAGVTVTT